MHGRGSMMPRSNNAHVSLQSRGATGSAQNSHSKQPFNAAREHSLSQGKTAKNRYKDDQDMLGGSVDEAVTSGNPLRSLLSHSAIRSPNPRH